MIVLINVIPAQAGIQSGYRRHYIETSRVWIPAYAGMTVLVSAAS